ncbi:response regulator transcription factor [Cohnella terricola]|uniref:Response regulator transcription factor n=2 Tax=Cohnella terricola TaxID=1289167 RepID=A0A559JNJ6_9BACL|nr:response regulator transcription factor [Cohnella terricola]
MLPRWRMYLHRKRPENRAKELSVREWILSAGMGTIAVRTGGRLYIVTMKKHARTIRFNLRVTTSSSGAVCMLEKSIGEREFIGSLQLVMQQLAVIPLHLARQLRTKGYRFASPYPESDNESRTLSDKEATVLKLISQGYKNKDIADRLFMSQRNVEYVISRLFEKSGASSRQEAVLKGIELKWLNLID